VGYLGYYLAWMLLSYGLRQPWLLVGLGVLWLLRGLIPGPGALFGSLGRARRLRQQVQVNRANITARRDLATIYLDLLRPRRAFELLDEGLALAPDDAELLYLSGLALHRAGQHEQALERLLRAVGKDQRLRHGEPYLVAGDALLALGRWDDAIDGYERFLDFNSSHVDVHTQLARAHVGARHADAARQALSASLATWHELPGSMKRRQFGAYLRALWAHITVLKDWRAIAFAIAGLALLSLGARAAWPGVLELFHEDEQEPALARLLDGFQRCGTQRTGDFEGEYVVSPQPPEGEDVFRVLPDRIINGSELVQEFCLTKVLERKPQLLRAEAVWHEDRGDPGDASLVQIWLSRGSDSVRFSFAPVEQPLLASTVTLRRKP
jgi:tetratricopeptide (TPR) repeat protein